MPRQTLRTSATLLGVALAIAGCGGPTSAGQDPAGSDPSTPAVLPPADPIAGLDFPGSAGAVTTIRFKFVNPHTNGLPAYGTPGNGVTYIWRAFPRQQSGYYTAFFWGNDDGRGTIDDTFLSDNGRAHRYYGAHPYPRFGTAQHDWEVAAEQADYVNGEVVYGRWYTQALRVWSDGAGKHHEFYWDLPNTDPAHRVVHTSPASWGNTDPPAPALTWGDAPWNPGHEVWSGVLRGIQIYSSLLTVTDVLAEVSVPLSTSLGTSSIWYLNINPTPVDISDKSGRGHDPVWVGPERPTLYTDGGATNTAPTVAAPASATPPVVAGMSAAVSVLGADDGGEAGLIYTWTATGSPPGPVTFSPNGTNGAKSGTASFTRAGTYTLVATIVDAGALSVTSTVTVTVVPTLTSLGVAPPVATVVAGGAQAFAATARDQFNQPMAAAVTWAVSGGGTISPSGVFTGGSATGGPFVITATSGPVSGTAQVTVTATPNQAPTVATAAVATPAPVTGTTAAVTVLGADDAGEAGLTYSWAATGSPPGAVTFGSTGTNASKASLATFTRAGTYNLVVTISDAGGLSVTSSLTVTVVATLGSLSLTPSSATVPAGGTRAFSVTGRDQFNQPVAAVVTWAVSGGGTISPSGVFSAGGTAGGPFLVTATSGTTTGTAQVTIAAQPNQTPTVATAATAGLVTGTTTVVTVLGADDGGEAGLTYTWSSTGISPGPIAFAPNGTNGAKSSEATFVRAGTYTLVATITDAGGLSVSSPVVITVTPTATTVEVSPATATVETGGTVAFGARIGDQFNEPMTAGATWAVSGGGTIGPSGGFAAGGAAGGPFTVTATSGTATGTAHVTVTRPVNQAPMVAIGASAGPADGTTVTVAVLGADDGSEAGLTYTWASAGSGPGPVTFAPNGTNGAKSSTATFTRAGSYTLVATITDDEGLSATSSVAVTVAPRVASLRVTPSTATVVSRTSQGFEAAALDQFNQPVTVAVTWTVSGGGLISTAGVFAAGSETGGPFTVTATGAAASGTAEVSVSRRRPRASRRPAVAIPAVP